MSDKEESVSDEEHTESIEALRELAREGPHVYALPYALAAVDAGLHVFFLTADIRFIKVRAQREVITTGSVRYALHFETYGEISGLYVRLVAPEICVIQTTINKTLEVTPLHVQEIMQGIAVHTMHMFIRWFRNDHEELVQKAKELATNERIPSPVDLGFITKAMEQHKPPRGRGAPPDPDNEWARQEAALGRDYDRIFEGYLQRQKVDPMKPQDVANARERFRKAMKVKRGK